MKNFKLLLIGFLVITSFISCSEDDDFTFIATQDSEGISFANSTSESYILRPDNRDGLAERFVWSEADFDVPTTVRYELQGASTESFATYTPFGQDLAETNYAVTIGQMIDLAEEAGLDNDPETEESNTGTVYFRVLAFAGTNSENNVEQYSDTLAVNVTLYEAVEEEAPSYPQFYLVGDATSAAWDANNNNMPLFRDADNENVFYFSGRFAGGEEVEGFKLLETLGDWDSQWGLSEGNLTSREMLGGDPDAFPVEEDAYYSLMVNTDEMTYSFEEIDASEGATYETMGLVGEGTSGGWPSDDNPTPDLELTNSTFNEHIWYANDVTLTEAPIKFRADKVWDVDWGAETFPAGQGTIGGSDIPATAGTYDVWFNDLTGRYIFIPVSE